MNYKYCVTVKKNPFNSKSYQEPAKSQQRACRGEEVSAHIVLQSVAGGDNREERFESLTWPTFTSPRVDKVGIDGPN